jgi:hypothetical protein
VRSYIHRRKPILVVIENVAALLKKKKFAADLSTLLSGFEQE